MDKNIQEYFTVRPVSKFDFGERSILSLNIDFPIEVWQKNDRKLVICGYSTEMSAEKLYKNFELISNARDDRNDVRYVELAGETYTKILYSYVHNSNKLNLFILVLGKLTPDEINLSIKEVLKYITK